jgi:hypothetical protein
VVKQINKSEDKIVEVEKQSLVVYHIKCSECQADYIGKTEKILAHRIVEYQSPRKDWQIHLSRIRTPQIDGP